METNVSVVVANKELVDRIELRSRLERNKYHVREATTERDLLASLVEPVDAVVVDDRIPESGALWLLSEIARRCPDTLVVLTSARSPATSPIERINPTAYHYTHEPGDYDSVLDMVGQALETRRSGRPTGPTAIPFERMLGRSTVFEDAKRVLRRVASAPPASMLISGEPGTGKTLACKLLHYNGDRATRPLFHMNVGDLPETLLASELFGHEAGAVPGAVHSRRGLLEVANGSTLVIDNITALPPTLQTKFLRFLDDRCFRRVGGVADIHVDVRVVATTSRNVDLLVERGAFRVELFYRLAGAKVHLPPLRDRKGDLPQLAEHFAERSRRELRAMAGPITQKAYELLEAYPWPGNVQQLAEAIEDCISSVGSGPLDAAAFQRHALPGAFNDEFRLPAGGVNFEELERDLVIQALERTGGNQTRASTLLGMNRDQIRYRIQKFSLERYASRRDSSGPPPALRPEPAES